MDNVRLNVLKLVLKNMETEGPDFKRDFVAPLVQELQNDKDLDISLALELIKDKM